MHMTRVTHVTNVILDVSTAILMVSMVLMFNYT